MEEEEKEEREEDEGSKEFPPASLAPARPDHTHPLFPKHRPNLKNIKKNTTYLHQLQQDVPSAAPET